MVYVNPKEISCTIETQFKSAIRLKLGEVYGKIKPMGAITLVTSPEDIRVSEELLTVYGKQIVVPINNTEVFTEEDGRYIIDILHSNTDIRDYIYYEDEYSDIGDGVVGGLPSWEFITSDFAKINRIRDYPGKKIHIVCYKWQKEIIEGMLDKEITFMVLTEDKKIKLKELIGGK